MAKPLIFYDLETTGVNLETDRIVSIAATKMTPDLRDVLDKKMVMVNPQMPIPKEASDVHGITDEMVAGKPVFAQYAKSLAEWMDGCDLAGFNILNFDVPLLGEEFERVGISWPAPGTLFIDVCRIFHEKEKRDLSGALKFYVNIDHETAHTADGDVDATIVVLKAQQDKYDDIRAMTVQQLAEFCMPEKRLDLAGKIVLNDSGVAVYGFGKDKGKSIKEFPGFANWMLKQPFPVNTKKALHKVLGWGTYKPRVGK